MEKRRGKRRRNKESLRNLLGNVSSGSAHRSCAWEGPKAAPVAGNQTWQWVRVSKVLLALKAWWTGSWRAAEAPRRSHWWSCSQFQRPCLLKMLIPWMTTKGVESAWTSDELRVPGHSLWSLEYVSLMSDTTLTTVRVWLCFAFLGAVPCLFSLGIIKYFFWFYRCLWLRLWTVKETLDF